jgi:hypothetical protein
MRSSKKKYDPKMVRINSRARCSENEFPAYLDVCRDTVFGPAPLLAAP